MFHPLTDTAGLDRAVARSYDAPVLLFKHSAACGISHAVRRRLDALTAPDDPPVYEVVVQHTPGLSQEIARRFGVRHASPQVLLLWRGEAVYDASHSRIRAEAVRAALPRSSPR